jgi:uncharacterized protein (DUF1499 family)
MKIFLIVVGVGVLGWAGTMVLFSVLSKKPDGLGAAGGRLAACPPSPNCVCSADADAAHAIEPLAFTDPPDEAWRRLEAVLAAHPRTHVVTNQNGYLHAECASFLFRFVDDVEFLLDREGKKIHVRSASRAGRSDLGVNRARVEAIRSAFGGG